MSQCCDSPLTWCLSLKTADDHVSLRTINFCWFHDDKFQNHVAFNWLLLISLMWSPATSLQTLWVPQSFWTLNLWTCQAMSYFCAFTQILRLPRMPFHHHYSRSTSNIPFFWKGIMPLTNISDSFLFPDTYKIALPNLLEFRCGHATCFDQGNVSSFVTSGWQHLRVST